MPGDRPHGVVKRTGDRDHVTNAGLGCAIVPASWRTLGLSNVTFMAIEGVNIRAHNFVVYSKTNLNPVLPVFLNALSEALINL